MVLAVTMGDPAGIGGELTLAAWLRRDQIDVPAFVALDNPSRLASLAEKFGWTVPLRVVETAEEARDCFGDALPVLPVALATDAVPGQADPRNAPAVIASIDRAVAMAMDGQVEGLVTQPIHKATLYGSGFAFPGHTEYLAHLTKAAEPSIMMLAGAGLRVVPLTIHEALSSAIARLDGAMIETMAHRVAGALTQDFGIAAPRLALAGLNPHAGEDGALGDEEVRFIRPAAERLRAAGLNISGPHAPDSMFHAAARANYDAALCLYHDQALIPLKTLAFDEGVNITLGLSIVRTSPDHGTAFDIAGKGVANPASFIAALREAQMIAGLRGAQTHKSRRAGR